MAGKQEGVAFGNGGKNVACRARSTLETFNCMISVFDYFVCRITLEQVLHDLSIMMLFVTTESIPIGQNQFFFF